VANWHAHCSQVGVGSLGSAIEDSERDREDIVHCPVRSDRPVTWIRKEGAKDTESGIDPGETPTESIEDAVMGKKNVGSSFDEFLREDDLLEEVTAVAIKRVVAHQLAALMKEQGLTKVEMARRMDTSRAALDRLLDPENPSVTLQTLQSAAAAVGGRLRVQLEFVDQPASAA
jgi:DNA-binding Xre family transcriptional regulator